MEVILKKVMFNYLPVNGTFRRLPPAVWIFKKHSRKKWMQLCVCVLEASHSLEGHDKFDLKAL